MALTLELTPPEIRILILSISTRMASCDDKEIDSLLALQVKLHLLMRGERE